mgnify:CR=1 FL=1
MYNLKYTKEFEKGLKKLSKAEQKASMHGREAPSMTGFQRFLTPNYHVNEYIEYAGGVFTWKNQQL